MWCRWKKQRKNSVTAALLRQPRLYNCTEMTSSNYKNRFMWKTRGIVKTNRQHFGHQFIIGSFMHRTTANERINRMKKKKKKEKKEKNDFSTKSLTVTRVETLFSWVSIWRLLIVWDDVDSTKRFISYRHGMGHVALLSLCHFEWGEHNAPIQQIVRTHFTRARLFFVFSPFFESSSRSFLHSQESYYQLDDVQNAKRRKQKSRYKVVFSSLSLWFIVLHLTVLASTFLLLSKEM